MKSLGAAALVALALCIEGCGGGGGGGGGFVPSSSSAPAASSNAPETSAVAPTPNSANGTYRVFSAVGSEFLFKVDFDLGQYVVLDKSGAALRSGTLKADATTAGTYVMVDVLTSLSASNNARFRMTADTLVGAMPVPLPSPNANNVLMEYPFVATRSLVTDKAALDGLYNRLDLRQTPGPSGFPSLSASRVRQVQIAGQGATLDQCNETATISPLTACTGAGKTLVHYTGSATPDAEGRWTFTNTVDGNDRLVFAVAHIDGENILLETGFDSLTPTDSIFRIGTPSVPAFDDLVAYGGSPMADWSRFTIAGSSITMDITSVMATATTETYRLLAPSAGEPQGFRKIDLGGGAVSFVTRSKALYVSAGYVSQNTGTVQIGLTH